MGDLLFLAHRIPYPPDRGDKIRSWNVLKHLASLGRVHLACFADDEADAAHLGALREALGGRLGEAHVEVRRTGRFAAAAEALRTGQPISLTMFDSARLRSFVEQMLARPDVSTVYAFSGQMAQFVPAARRQLFVMDFVDMDSAKFADYAGAGPMRWVHRREAARLLDFERATAARADTSLFVSEAEKQLFLSRTGLPAARVQSLPNGVDLDFYRPDAAFPRVEAGEGPLIVFTGQMDYRPNVEAVTSFAQEAFQLARESRPDLRFAIVGRNPTPVVVQLADRPGIQVTGSVPDVRSWLAAADLVVAPLRIARGIQNKVLEAMAMGKAVVASAPAFEGIDARPGRDLIVAESAGEQAGAILSFLANPEAAGEMGQAARRQMEERYRWEAVLAPLTEILASTGTRAAA